MITDVGERQTEAYKNEASNAIVAERQSWPVVRPNGKKIRFSFNEHSNIFHAYMIFGAQLHDYRIVTIERNPWEKAISQYFYLLKSRLNGQSFTDFVR